MASRRWIRSWGVSNALDIRRTEEVLWLEGLPPAFDGLRILHMTDPHFDSLPALGPAIVSACSGRSPDLFVMTGDYQAGDPSPPPPYVADMCAAAAIAADARFGSFAVLGNHDGSGMLEALESRGVRVLCNESVSLSREGSELVLTGVDDCRRFRTPMAVEALSHAASSRPGAFGILLAHSPDSASDAAAHGRRLMLCGHTHAGQVSVAGHPIFVAGRHRSLAAGTWSIGALSGRTSSGAGVSGVFPMRFGTRGEVALLVLRSGRRPG